jgi:hypothetical protein
MGVLRGDLSDTSAKYMRAPRLRKFLFADPRQSLL